MRKWVWQFSVTAVVGLMGLLAFFPASQKHTLVAGVDSYNTHRLIFRTREFTQEIASDLPVLGVGAILVDIRRTGNPAPVTARIESMDGDKLFEGEIPASAIQNNVFAYVELPHALRLPGGRATVTLQSPEATTANPAGWRYDPKSSSLARYENGRLQEGAFAVQIKEQVPLWKAIRSISQANVKQTFLIIFLLFGLGTYYLLASQYFWRNTPVATQRKIQAGIIAVIALAAFISRVRVETQLGGVSGGDPYNYLFIARAITEFDNPFAGVKRLPGYPLLLTPLIVNPAIDAHTYMRIISALAASGSVFLAFLLARHLGFAWPAQLGTAALLAWQKDFWTTSLRPEPYSLFGFLLLACLLLFFTAKRPWQYVLFSITLGYAAMTRQEGFVLAVILFIAHLFRTIFRESLPVRVTGYGLRVTAYMFLPALLIVMPFFFHNTVSYGNPLYTEYFEGERLQIIDSWPAFVDAATAATAIGTSMWKPSWTQLELILPYDHSWVLLGFFGAIAWWVGIVHLRIHERRSVSTYILSLVAIATCAALIYFAAINPSGTAKYGPLFIAGVLFAAPFLFLPKTGWRGILVLIVLISQILIATWFHPFPKHYQQSYPLICLIIAGALFSIHPKKKKLWEPLMVLAWVAPFVCMSGLLFWNLHIFVDSHNAGAARDSVAYRAARYAIKLPGPYGIADDNLAARLYLPPESHYSAGLAEPFFTWLTSASIRTFILVDTVDEDNPIPAGYEKVVEFKAEGDDEFLHKAAVYTK